MGFSVDKRKNYACVFLLGDLNDSPEVTRIRSCIGHFYWYFKGIFLALRFLRFVGYVMPVLQWLSRVTRNRFRHGSPMSKFSMETHQQLHSKLKRQMVTFRLVPTPLGNSQEFFFLLTNGRALSYHRESLNSSETRDISAPSGFVIPDSLWEVVNGIRGKEEVISKRRRKFLHPRKP